MTVKRGTCRVCRRPITIKGDGTLRHHTDPRQPKDSLIWSPRCDGAGTYPAHPSETERDQ